MFNSLFYIYLNLNLYSKQIVLNRQVVVGLFLVSTDCKKIRFLSQLNKKKISAGTKRFHEFSLYHSIHALIVLLKNRMHCQRAIITGDNANNYLLSQKQLIPRPPGYLPLRIDKLQQTEIKMNCTQGCQVLNYLYAGVQQVMYQKNATERTTSPIFIFR